MAGLISAVSKCFFTSCKPCASATKLYFGSLYFVQKHQIQSDCSALRVHSRCLHFTASSATLWDRYKKLKQSAEAGSLPVDRDPRAIYANNELQLGEIDVYGFDYDYTIACYNDNLNQLIYNLGRANLIKDFKYPIDIEHADYNYNPSFSVRGLHCDVKRFTPDIGWQQANKIVSFCDGVVEEKVLDLEAPWGQIFQGYLMKIDAFHNIQMGSVYCGLQPVPDEKVIDEYGGRHVSVDNLSNYYGTGPKMFQLMDMFAFPEMNLYANIIEFFTHHDIAYDPEHVFYDVRNAVQSLHSSGTIHQHIMEHHDKFVTATAQVPETLKRLSTAGKKMFLITNSSANFVDKGMTYLVGADWMNLFDVIITHARKPKFFYDANRPFRMYDYKNGVKNWNKVDRLVKGSVYEEGNYNHLIKLTGWTGGRVLYIGDHVYTDLADATLKLGWRTGAIIPELENEIRIINTETYKKSLVWLVTLESLISQMQNQQDADSQQVLAEWIHERNELRLVMKELFNKRFGSLFRTYHNPTYFTRRLNRFADIYMSSVVNFLNYPLNHAFYPQRTALPHELTFPSFVL